MMSGYDGETLGRLAKMERERDDARAEVAKLRKAARALIDAINNLDEVRDPKDELEAALAPSTAGRPTT